MKKASKGYIELKKGEKTIFAMYSYSGARDRLIIYEYIEAIPPGIYSMEFKQKSIESGKYKLSYWPGWGKQPNLDSFFVATFMGAK